CAGLITGGADDIARLARDTFAGDATMPAVDAYRQIIEGADATDAGRLGAAVNLQSIVTTFTYRDRSVLLGGDMQFADPQVDDPAITAGIAQLRKTIAEEPPFTMAKLSHHGSNNAFDEQMLGEMRTKYIGICAGSGSRRHPNKATLDILQAN